MPTNYSQVFCTTWQQKHNTEDTKQSVRKYTYLHHGAKSVCQARPYEKKRNGKVRARTRRKIVPSTWQVQQNTTVPRCHRFFETQTVFTCLCDRDNRRHPEENKNPTRRERWQQQQQCIDNNEATALLKGGKRIIRLRKTSRGAMLFESDRLRSQRVNGFWTAFWVWPEVIESFIVSSGHWLASNDEREGPCGVRGLQLDAEWLGSGAASSRIRGGPTAVASELRTRCLFQRQRERCLFSLLWLRLTADDVPRLIIISCVANDVPTAVGTAVGTSQLAQVRANEKNAEERKTARGDRVACAH